MIISEVDLAGRENQKFSLGQVRFEMPIRYPNGDVEWAEGESVRHSGSGQTCRYECGAVDT